MGLEKLDINNLRFMLEKAKEEILKKQHKNLRNIAEENDHLNRQVFDEGELAEANVRLEINASLTEDSSLLLKKIQAALKRIKMRTYGRCIDCRGEIHPQRLLVVPWELQCVECKNSEETALGSESKKSKVL